MKLADSGLMALADTYLWAGMGQKIHGLIHNLNNHAHVMDMQVNMLAAKADSSADEPLKAYEDKLARLANGTASIVENLQKNGRCSFFAQKSQTQINVHDFLSWMVDFWGNDLFFKHHISCRLFHEDQGINLQMPPFYLTLCLEQGIRNVVEACHEMESSKKHRLQIRALPAGNGGVKIILQSSTQVPDLDPWAQGSSSKPGHLGMGLPLAAFLAGRMGWSINLSKGESETGLEIIIPEQKSVERD